MTTIRKILCPVDFSETSLAALKHAEELSVDFDAELVLVHVVTAPLYPAAYGAAPVWTGKTELSVLTSAQSRIDELVTELEGRGRKVTAAVEQGPSAPTIVEAVERHGVDLVVMATHGLTGFSHVLLGSVAERVVRTCPCPVLTIKASRLAAEMPRSGVAETAGA